MPSTSALRDRTIATLFCLFSPLAFCQASATNSVSTLRTDFAVQAIKTLRLIEGETDKPSLGSDGDLLVPRETAEALDDLDAEAQTPTDKDVVITLRTFWSAKLDHNTEISTITHWVRAQMTLNEAVMDPAVIADKVGKSPITTEAHTKDTACGDQLETELRARLFTGATACTEAALDVPAPRESDYVKW